MDGDYNRNSSIDNNSFENLWRIRFQYSNCCLCFKQAFDIIGWTDSFESRFPVRFGMH